MRNVNRMIKISRYKPSVTNHLLLLLAGSIWMIVGLGLLLLAISWLSKAANVQWFWIPGILLALLIHHLGFLKIVDHNLRRIRLMKGKSCLFAFVSWKSYLVIAVMITMGAILRHSTLPKHYLAILYIGMGLALVLSSLRYFRVFIQIIRG